MLRAVFKDDMLYHWMKRKNKPTHAAVVDAMHANTNAVITRLQDLQGRRLLHPLDVVDVTCTSSAESRESLAGDGVDMEEVKRKAKKYLEAGELVSKATMDQYLFKCCPTWLPWY